jgi:hypothetical protein
LNVEFLARHEVARIFGYQSDGEMAGVHTG